MIHSAPRPVCASWQDGVQISLTISHNSLAKQAFHSLSAHNPCWAFLRRVFSPLQNLIEPDSVLDCWPLDQDREFRHWARTGHDWVFTEFCNCKRDRHVRRTCRILYRLFRLLDKTFDCVELFSREFEIDPTRVDLLNVSDRIFCELVHIPDMDSRSPHWGAMPRTL